MATLHELASLTGGQVFGNSELEITGVSEIQNGQADTITFLSNPKYKQYAFDTGASAIITTDEDILSGTNGILVKNPQLAFAKVLDYFYQSPEPEKGIHKTAIILEKARVGEEVSVGPYSIIEANATIGNNTIIGSNTIIGQGVSIGANCHLHNNIHIYHHCTIGDNNTIFSGVVIGSDGFGYVEDGGEHNKIPQTGTVITGSNVDIGANCTIDRGTIGDTVIGPGSKFDNLVHIAHNVKTGKGCLFAAGVSIAGSVEMGDFCIFAGHSGSVPHVKIGDGAVFAIKSVATKSLPGGRTYAGMPAREIREHNKKDAVLTEVASLKKRIAKLENADNAS
ncbi:MAG TPA: UDP-3-O-(3-hydroxymyristoyl)glucosamine N-acyltransferase [Candidatus Marinimicrobia bacterium]|nr:UDP-3-O-(3-hydroxymyristoyl)glucosamine N-acyltransferase [Candidatus Neomarinimicrobiota bacterium]MDP7331089.1 UDP-3-O-(3-hydroxymyristoyl)glucosamine N-acyltransferase [Candidatus Neomarinimicrobiota bacterium]HJL75515.1 UDP-3-O-(3-hydroxymyristoyl)glucosamine N-acyltransferase [Candidatus Neomarinimicrobiota bacterium]HJM70544.1 UDP-3-O-(3-hydroxymyristoyl)glucosamine N-acyltransferase [Candidatus Neomarinimicrobiota bacterium]